MLQFPAGRVGGFERGKALFGGGTKYREFRFVLFQYGQQTGVLSVPARTGVGDGLWKRLPPIGGPFVAEVGEQGGECVFE